MEVSQRFLEMVPAEHLNGDQENVAIEVIGDRKIVNLIDGDVSLKAVADVNVNADLLVAFLQRTFTYMSNEM